MQISIIHKSIQGFFGDVWKQDRKRLWEIKLSNLFDRQVKWEILPRSDKWEELTDEGFGRF